MKCPKCRADNTDTARFCSNCAAPLTSASAAGAQPSFTETIEIPAEKLIRGTVFANRYEIIEELGAGGMGRVYRAEDTKVKEQVALKLIRPEIAADRNTIDRFRNELKVARRVRHKNVTGMYDLGEDRGTHYIAMEYVPGEDLKSLIRRVGQLPIPKSVSIAAQVCEGLSEAHRLGVVHRDLKPSNIMIDREGNARIMDFGIARSIKRKSLTDAGIMVGTPEYMSPEQAEAKDVDGRSDIYSLGIILYEMLTGRVPFSGDTPLSVALKQKTEEPPDPLTLNPQIPEELGRLILRCLEKDGEKRYARAEDVLAELKRVETDVTPASGLSRPPTSLRIKKRRRTLAAVLVPAAAIALAAIAFLIIRTAGTGLDPNLVVVGLFENNTGNESLDPLGRMTADQVTQGLKETGIIPTVPTPTVEAAMTSFKGGDAIRFLARKTGAALVISGAFYLQGTELRLQAQITDAKAKELLQALEPVTGPIEEPSRAVESLRQRLMGILATKFHPRTRPFFKSFGLPPSYEAFQEYAEGLELFMRGEYRDGAGHLNRAGAQDPGFVIPLLFAAVAHLNTGDYAQADAITQEIAKSKEKLLRGDRLTLDWLQGWLRGDRLESLRAVRELYRLTLELNQRYQLGLDANRANYPRETVQAYAGFDLKDEAMRGWYHFWDNLTTAHHMLGEHKRELKEARRGRKQYPELLATLFYETRALAALGRIEELNQRLDESLNLPPQSGWTPAGVMRLAAEELRAHGHRAESLKAAERSIAWYQAYTDQDHRSGLAYSLYTAERWDEARALGEALRQEHPDNEDWLGFLGVLAARRGDRDEAMRISGELKAIDRPYMFGNHTYWRACIAALMGEKEAAMNLLREALAQGVTYTRLHPNMDLEPLWDYPPFRELIKPKG